MYEMGLVDELRTYREHPREVERVTRLLALLPSGGATALDVGARDGHISMLLAERYARVVALDLNTPDVTHPRVECVHGDAAALAFPDGSFHTVVCAEVLEHLPRAQLLTVCGEIARVASNCVIIGVPYREDSRVACTTCRACGTTNPPWGHVNSFDEQKLISLMTGLAPAEIDYVGRTRSATNRLSARLMSYAGNPYGTYDQHEPCIQCGKRLSPPVERSFVQKLATKVASWGTGVQVALSPWRANWLHVRFEK